MDMNAWLLTSSASQNWCNDVIVMLYSQKIGFEAPAFLVRHMSYLWISVRIRILNNNSDLLDSDLFLDFRLDPGPV